jgi:hypothetical protein
MRRTLAVVALVAALGACVGGGGDDDVSGAGVPRHDAERERVGDQPVDADGNESVVAGSAELEEALLTVDDLPDELIELDLHYSAVEICGMRTEMPRAIEGDEYPSGAAAFALDDEPIVPDVFEKLVVVPPGAGAAVFQHARESLEMTCNSGGHGDGLTFLRATDLTVPTLGDETVAKRVTIEEQRSGTTVAIDVLYARAGDTIVAIGVVEPEGQTDRLVELAQIAFDRATAS